MTLKNWYFLLTKASADVINDVLLNYKGDLETLYNQELRKYDVLMSKINEFEIVGNKLILKIKQQWKEMEPMFNKEEQKNAVKKEEILSIQDKLVASVEQYEELRRNLADGIAYYQKQQVDKTPQSSRNIAPSFNQLSLNTERDMLNNYLQAQQSPNRPPLPSKPYSPSGPPLPPK
eukprot:NODE_990_length_2498_cov_0.366820.p2 type:complete len:176 gc:universal NODE_990_length_2498_cov_0.366820:682-155(-)